MPTTKKSKRPLTPYNLFYRFKRSRILNACSNGTISKEATRKLVAAIPGLEDFSASEFRALHPKDMLNFSRGVIRQELEGNLLPFEGKRSHRKSHGAMSFLEMNRVMCDQWKLVDESIKAIFQELANEGKQLYKQELQTPTQNDVDIDNQTQDVQDLTNMTIEHIQPSTDFFGPPLPPSSASVVSFSPSPTKLGKVNIVSPIPSPIPSNHCFNHYTSDKTSTGEETPTDDDDFCDFIDKNIHLVDTDEPNDDLNTIDFSYTSGMPSSLRDLLDMDEMIEHCRLPF